MDITKWMTKCMENWAGFLLRREAGKPELK